jgi:hypothetical protein
MLLILILSKKRDNIFKKLGFLVKVSSKGLLKEKSNTFY